MSLTVVISSTFLPEDALRLPWRLFQACQGVIGPAALTDILGADLFELILEGTQGGTQLCCSHGHPCVSGLFLMWFSSAGDILVLVLLVHNDCMYSFMLHLGTLCVFHSQESL